VGVATSGAGRHCSRLGSAGIPPAGCFQLASSSSPMDSRSSSHEHSYRGSEAPRRNNLPTSNWWGRAPDCTGRNWTWITTCLACSAACSAHDSGWPSSGGRADAEPVQQRRRRLVPTDSAAADLATAPPQRDGDCCIRYIFRRRWSAGACLQHPRRATQGAKNSTAPANSSADRPSSKASTPRT